ncbi:MAG: ATP phosphoribosyltransferase [Alphaproteobacteria bacterium]
MSDNLILALPSKGRLKEQVEAYFKAAGLKIAGSGDGRGYTGASLKGVPGVEILFVQAGEIPTLLESGDVHLGVTGQDLLRDRLADPDAVLSEILTLGFGHARLVVAVPTAWMDVDTMADLKDVAGDLLAKRGHRMRVATKYFTSTRRFFAQHDISDYRIVESLGATEGAPNSGAAEIIVDITSTGATLVANNLKILSDGQMLASEACLAGSRTAAWSEGQLQALRQILDMVAARDRAKGRLMVVFEGDSAAYSEIVDELTSELGCITGISQGSAKGNGSYAVYVEERNLYPLIHRLREAGFQRVAASAMDYLFEDPNPLYAGFVAAITK